MTLIYALTEQRATSGESDRAIDDGLSTHDPVADRMTVSGRVRLDRPRIPTARFEGKPGRREICLHWQVTPTAYFRWKRAFDLTVALLLLIPGLPLIVLLGLLVRLTSPGPALFRQKRVGAGGRHFCLYKIRTMRQDAETTTGPVWSLPGDPRMTRVGKWLRRLHLDELPQIFNVLRGDMALVGPRPERPIFVVALEPIVPGYHNRTAVRPGVTGLAQLNLDPDTDLCNVCHKTVLDIDYIKHATLWLDLRIILCTGLRIPKLASYALLRLFGVSRRVVIQGCAAEAGDPHDAHEPAESPPCTPLQLSHAIPSCCDPIRTLLKANGQAGILTQQLIRDLDRKPNKPR